MAKVLEGLYYSESHEFVRVEGDYGFVGITDYAQNALGNVVYVDMPEVDDEVTAGEEFGAVESVKAASDLISPVSGTVVEINEDLEDTPELINHRYTDIPLLRICISISLIQRMTSEKCWKEWASIPLTPYTAKSPTASALRVTISSHQR